MARSSSTRKKTAASIGVRARKPGVNLTANHEKSATANNSDLDKTPLISNLLDIDGETENHGSIADDDDGAGVFPSAGSKAIRDPHYKVICSRCNRAFKRREHLDRHMLLHTGEKPWQCSVCLLSFRRKDTMTRHLKGHQTTQGAFTFMDNTSARAGSACLQCATSKLKCDGRRPCARCTKKRESCKDPSPGKPRSTAAASVLDGGAAPTVPTPVAVNTRPKTKAAPKFKAQIPQKTYDEICNLFDEQRPSLEDWVRRIALPVKRRMEDFLQLYFDECASRFPLVHIPSFESSGKSSSLVLAMCIVGSDFSTTHVDDMVKELFAQIGRQIWALSLAKDGRIDNITEAQTLFLLSFSLLFDLDPTATQRFRFQQTALVAFCRLLSQKEYLLLDEEQIQLPYRTAVGMYQQFIELEEERRFISCVWILECLASIYLDIPMLMGITDLTRSLPCHEDLWAMSQSQWQKDNLIKSATSSVCSIMSSGPIENTVCCELGQLSASVLHLTAFVEQRRLRKTIDVWLRPRILHTKFMRSASVLNFDVDDDGGGVASLLETDLNCFEGRYRAALRPTRLTSDFHKYFQVTQVLRLVEYKTLCAFFGVKIPGWKPSDYNSEDAAKELAETFANDAPRARKVLLFSVELFLRFRTWKAVPCHEMHGLLAATFYMCAWIALAPENIAQSRIAAATLGPPAEQVVCLDQFDAYEAQRWVLSGSDLFPLIAETGILHGQQAAKRILRETGSTVRRRGLTTPLGAFIVRSVDQLTKE